MNGADNKKISLLLNKDIFCKIFSQDNFDELRSFSEIINPGGLPEKVDEDYIRKVIPGAAACITCWGTPKIPDEGWNATHQYLRGVRWLTRTRSRRS
jgi:hypothetical protein